MLLYFLQTCFGSFFFSFFVILLLLWYECQLFILWHTLIGGGVGWGLSGMLSNCSTQLLSNTLSHSCPAGNFTLVIMALTIAEQFIPVVTSLYCSQSWNVTDSLFAVRAPFFSCHVTLIKREIFMWQLHVIVTQKFLMHLYISVSEMWMKTLLLCFGLNYAIVNTSRFETTCQYVK